MTRRQFGLLSGVAAAGALATPASPAGVKKLKITRVHTVEVRNVVTGKGLVLPVGPAEDPAGHARLRNCAVLHGPGRGGHNHGRRLQTAGGHRRGGPTPAEAYFVGKDPFDLAIHNAQFFQKEKAPAPVRLFFLEVALWDIIGKATQASRCIKSVGGGGGQGAAVRQQRSISTRRRRSAPRTRSSSTNSGFTGDQAAPASSEDPKDDLKLVATVKKAVGDKMEVMVDANMAGKKKGDPPPVWDFETALHDGAGTRADRALLAGGAVEPRHDYDDLARDSQATQADAPGGRRGQRRA